MSKLESITAFYVHTPLISVENDWSGHAPTVCPVYEHMLQRETSGRFMAQSLIYALKSY